MDGPFLPCFALAAYASDLATRFLDFDISNTAALPHDQSLTMWRPSVFLAAVLAVPSQALHFFIDGAVQKCFFEELPKDTLVVGMRTAPDLSEPHS
jgi:hypothetical protein